MKLPRIEGWEFDPPHHKPGGGGCNADSAPYWRTFAHHKETLSTVTIVGGTEAECVGNIEKEIREFEEANGIGLKLPEGWRLEFSESSAGGKICMMQARKGDDIATALGTSRLDAKVRLIEEICDNRTLANRISRIQFLTKQAG